MIALGPAPTAEAVTRHFASPPVTVSKTTTVSLTEITLSTPAGIVTTLPLAGAAPAPPAVAEQPSYAMCNLFCSDQIT